MTALSRKRRFALLAVISLLVAFAGLGLRGAWLEHRRVRPERSVGSIAFSPDERFLVTDVSGWSLEDGLFCESTPRPLGTNLGGPHAIAFSPDGTRLLVGSGEGVQVWDTRTWQRESSFVNPGIWAAAFASRPGRLIAMTSRDGRHGLVDLDVATGRDLRLIRSAEDAGVLSADGTEALMKDLDGKLCLVRTETGSARPFAIDPRWAARALTRERVLFDLYDSLAVHDPSREVWAMATPNHDFIGNPPARAMALSRDGSLVASILDLRNQRRLAVWNIDRRELLLERDMGSRVWGLAFSPSGRFLAVGNEGEVRILSLGSP